MISKEKEALIRMIIAQLKAQNKPIPKEYEEIARKMEEEEKRRQEKK
jgi:hypothetical protein